MNYLELTFADPPQNLACDELLLNLCEKGAADEILRIWEPAVYFVVLGHSNRIASEVHIAACAAEKIPVFRRFSGGGAVLQGPGCLNYSLVLKNTRRGPFRDIAQSFRRILEPHKRLLSRLLSRDIAIQGISDLTLDGRKFSGNSQYRKPLCTLYHGTFLLNLDVSLVEKCLAMPSRQPDYRGARRHSDFLTQLTIDPVRLRRALREEWAAEEEFRSISTDGIDALVRDRYGRPEWNLKF